MRQARPVGVLLVGSGSIAAYHLARPAAAEGAGVRILASRKPATAEALIAEGAIGRVESIRMRNATPGADWNEWFFDPTKVSGGVIHQLGVHGIDLILYLFGEITAVSAMHATLRPRRRLADGREIA